ncbi:MAG TPA: metalloregulator ArsR/SmtB family transcription factor [Terriglobales bacterium]|nr:metalloregulator ArsR/SmtB family transcription factor [Terriglobales bacterium]
MSAAIETELVQQLKAISDPARMTILECLKNPQCCALDLDKGMCACDIESQLKLSQPTISHHMKVLREAGLVDAEKVGQWMWYRRNEKALKELSRAIGAL